MSRRDTEVAATLEEIDRRILALKKHWVQEFLEWAAIEGYDFSHLVPVVDDWDGEPRLGPFVA